MRVRRNIEEGIGLGLDAITIIVGPDQETETFVVKEFLLRKSSTYFKNCLSSPCKERFERIVKLPQFKPDTFKIFAQFLYSGLLYMTEEGDVNVTLPTGAPTLSNNELARCMSLYKMADYLEAPDLKDAVLDAIIEIMGDLNNHAAHAGNRLFLTQDCVRFLYAHSTKDSPVRKFVVDWAMKTLDHTNYEAATKFEDQMVFMFELVMEAGPLISGEKSMTVMKDPFALEKRCRYHEHTVAGKACYRYKYESG